MIRPLILYVTVIYSVFCLCLPTAVVAQLLVTPHAGLINGNTKADETTQYSTSDRFTSFPELGVEVAYGITKGVALGLGYSYSYSTQEIRETNPIQAPVIYNEVAFNRHLATLRLKYAFLDRMFLHAGMTHGFYSSINLSQSGDPESEAFGKRMLGPHIGLDLIYKNVVLGANYHHLWGYGSKTNTDEGVIGDESLVQIYLGYLFRIKIARAKEWEFTCPKF